MLTPSPSFHGCLPSRNSLETDGQMFARTFQVLPRSLLFGNVSSFDAADAAISNKLSNRISRNH